MEYLPGMSLGDLVERHGPLPPGRAVYLLRQVALALEEAHEAGLIHRDIKPSNIFAARRGGMDDVAKLLDFGLGRPAATCASARTNDSWHRSSVRRSTCRPSRRQPLDRSTRGATSTHWVRSRTFC